MKWDFFLCLHPDVVTEFKKVKISTFIYFIESVPFAFQTRIWEQSSFP